MLFFFPISFATQCRCNNRDLYNIVLKISIRPEHIGKPLEFKQMLVFKSFAACFWALQWRHNEHDDVWNHQPYGCLLNRLFRRRWKKTSKLRVTGLCGGIYRWPVKSPYKGPVTHKMFSCDDVIMFILNMLMFFTFHIFSSHHVDGLR